MRYFTLGSLLAMVALSLSFAQSAQAYIFGLSNGKQPFTLTLNPGTSDSKTLLSKDSGWYSNVDPYHISGYQNYIVAQSGDVDAAEYRNFFVFNIEGLSSQVPVDSTATLTLYSYNVTSNNTTYTLYDVDTEIHTLIDGITPPNVFPRVFSPDPFTDLGSVEPYGSRVYESDEDNDFYPIALNSKFIVDLNLAIAAREKRIAIGGALTPNDIDRELSGGTGNPAGPVPEPSTLLLLGLALVGLAAWRRKHAA